MSINLQKILFGFLFCFIIICLLFNNSNFQTRFISLYFNSQNISNQSISFNNFDYNFLTGNCYSDLYIIDNLDNKKDTIIFIDDVALDLNIFDIVFFKKITLDQIQIDSSFLNLSNENNTDSFSFDKLFSIFSSFEHQISFNQLVLSDMMILNNNHILDNLDITIDTVLIKKNHLSIQNLYLKKDSFLLHASSDLNEHTLIVDILNFNDNNSLFKKYEFNRLFSSSHVSGNGSLSINSDSIVGSTTFLIGESQLILNFVNKHNNKYIIDYQGNFQSHDLTNSLNNLFNSDNLFLNGNLSIEKNNLFDEYDGVCNLQYGSIKFDLKKDVKGSDLNFNLIDFDFDFLNKSFVLNKINSKGLLHFQDNQLIDLDIDIVDGFCNDYRYKNINIKSLPSDNNVLLYSVQINDQNLKLTGYLNIDYSTNYNATIYNPIFSGYIDKLNLNNLNVNMNKSLDYISSAITISGFNFQSLNNQVSISMLNPYVLFEDFSYQNNNSNRTVSFIKLATNKYFNKFSLNSSIGKVSLDLFSKSIFSIKEFDYNTPFIIDLDLNQASVISDLFSNSIKLDDELKIHADYQKNNLLSISLYSPFIQSSHLSFSNINLSTSKSDVTEYNFSVDSILISDELSLDSIVFSSTMQNIHNGNYRLIYSSGLNQGKLIGDIFFNRDTIGFNFDSESVINFFNQSWRIDSVSKLYLERKKINFKEFALQMDGQKLMFDGYLNKNPRINFSFNDFKLHYLNPFLDNQSFSFDGVLDGDILFHSNTFPMMSGDFEVDNFKLNDVLLGQLKLTNTSNQGNDSIYTNGVIRSHKEILTLLAKYPLDGTKNINASILFNDFPARIFDTILNPISQLRGSSYGNLKITGLINNYDVNGQAVVKDLEFNIPYLGTNYFSNNNDLILNFDSDSIISNSINMYDKKYRTNAILKGHIAHSALKDMYYNISIKSDSLFVLNTNKNTNNNYYGNAFLAGDMTINGGPKTVRLDIDGSSKKGSRIMIPLSNSKEIKKNEFIQFVNVTSNQENPLLSLNTKPKFNMDFNLLIDSQSEIKLIFDEEVGDIITGYGQGDLSLKINKEGDFEVYGDFEIDQGAYLFTLQDVITKSFQIEKGGVINFDGNPYNAYINLNLLYNVQASLNPLNSDYDRDKKSPVICKMKMLGPLLNPEISFDIDILNSDQIAETSLESITNTDQKLLEQFLYLLIANSFLVENDPTIDYLGNTLATTGTELLSNQLSNWLSQTTDAFDLGFKWIPGTGDSLSYQQVELAVSKKFLDDRVVINGNVGTPPEQSEANIVGDLDIEYDFFKDGKLKLRVFNRTKDYDPLSESLGYEQGFGIFFKKQFNNFKELFIIDQND